MMNREEREARSAFWMQDLRECSSAGERLSEVMAWTPLLGAASSVPKWMCRATT